jgi:hypothetical protein
LLTPGHGSLRRDSDGTAQRQIVLAAAYHTHPDRFVRRAPKPLPLPVEVWINRPVLPGRKTDEGSQRIPIPGVLTCLTRAAVHDNADPSVLSSVDAPANLVTPGSSRFVTSLQFFGCQEELLTLRRCLLSDVASYGS